ncbi:DUF4252 domain-containing protein [Perlabentimonas gracilis]|uniref:DUF4252 domain-containing protein n=1 Tax=Perlabentimonas gracilis TaxID=2715279 RepID=UPI001409AF19|nr:DUF4252 domain-containing protein [Perlabentimonas gracilis]NHB69667.1 DUF4252 domain-containing protein [Perlabentimonas gracilis]
MRKTIALVVLLLFTGMLFAQKSPVDKLFDRYAGKDGYTSIFISEYMFTLFANLNEADKEFQDVVKGLSGIKILATEKQNPDVDFHKEIMKELPTNEYKELMVIREKEQNLTFLIKDIKGKVVELLLIVGGSENVLISIQGRDINLQNISKLSKSMNIDALGPLENI